MAKPGETTWPRSTNSRTASYLGSSAREGRWWGSGSVSDGTRKGFTRHPQDFAAACQDGQLRAGVQQNVCQAGAGLQQVFAVVQDQQQAFLAQEIHQRIADVVPGCFRHTQGRSHRLGHQGRVGQRSQLHQPGAVGVMLKHLSRYLQRTGVSCLCRRSRSG